MTSQEIADSVNFLVEYFVATKKPRPTQQELQFVQVGVDLITNFLQNLNEIAYAATETNERESRQ